MQKIFARGSFEMFWQGEGAHDPTVIVDDLSWNFRTRIEHALYRGVRTVDVFVRAH